MEIASDAGPGLEVPWREPIPWLEKLNKALGTLVEIPAALLVLAEVVVLLMGVTSRYVFHQPLVWSDELASILFLWLAMLGSIIAFQRGEHMRMTAIVGKLEPRGRAFLDLIAIAAGIAFLTFVVHPAYEFAQDEMFVTTPAMGIVNSWRAAALPIGLGLMLLIGLVQIFRHGRLKDVLLALGLVAVIVGVLAAVGGALRPLGNWNLLLFFVVGVLALVLLGVPIAFSFGLATFGYITLTTTTPTIVLVGRMDEGMSHLILLAVPLFVLLAC
jgi:TRAP-type C4-dicarboxylate transport system permease small subunit